MSLESLHVMVVCVAAIAGATAVIPAVLIIDTTAETTADNEHVERVLAKCAPILEKNPSAHCIENVLGRIITHTHIDRETASAILIMEDPILRECYTTHKSIIQVNECVYAKYGYP